MDANKIAFTSEILPWNTESIWLGVLFLFTQSNMILPLPFNTMCYLLHISLSKFKGNTNQEEKLALGTDGLSNSYIIFLIKARTSALLNVLIMSDITFQLE